MTEDELTTAFSYLDRLRASGVTNMWNAAPYVQRHLGETRERSVRFLALWMDAFDHFERIEDRVKWVIDRGTGP